MTLVWCKTHDAQRIYNRCWKAMAHSYPEPCEFIVWSCEVCE